MVLKFYSYLYSNSDTLVTLIGIFAKFNLFTLQTLIERSNKLYSSRLLT